MYMFTGFNSLKLIYNIYLDVRFTYSVVTSFLLL